VYSLDATEKLKICFVDDEQDHVAMSSDEEFLYAVDLVRPVRLVITLASCIPGSTCIPSGSTCVPSGSTCVASCIPGSTGDSCQVVLPDYPGRRGRGRGHCRGDKLGWNEERMKRKVEDPSLSNEERIQRKTTKISEKIKQIEGLLLTELPAPRERSLTWKLERLQFKLARLQSWSEPGTETPLPVPEPSRRGCRGRGGRGRGGFGRGKWVENSEDASCGGGQIDYRVWENVRTCRKNLRAANQSGNQEEIERCSKALEDAKTQKWEAKQKAKSVHREGKPVPEPSLFDKKSRKRECMKNLRLAQASGDAEKIFAAEQALIEAKEALQKAKVASKC